MSNLCTSPSSPAGGPWLQRFIPVEPRLSILAAVTLAFLFPGLARSGDEPQSVPLPVGVLLAERDFQSADPQLTRLIHELLTTQPQLMAARKRWEASSEFITQEKALPDPTFSYRWFASTPETRVGPQEHSFEFSQRVPWGGKRKMASQRASHLAGSAAWEIQGRARALVAHLKHDYFQVAYLQEAMAINQDETDLLGRFEAIALTRYATGRGIQQSVVKVQTEISRLIDQRIGLRRQLIVTQERIRHHIGLSEPSLDLQPISLSLDSMDPVDVEQAEHLLAEHPIMKTVTARAAADEALIRGRSLESRPDFNFEVGYTVVGRRQDPLGVAVPPEDNGKDILALSVNLNLPVHRRRNRAATAEAEMSRSATMLDLANTHHELQFQFRDAMERHQESSQRARLYEEVIIPQAEAALGSGEAAYATNKIDFLELLDSERVLFQVRLTYHRLLADHWIALADLEFSLATPFPPPPDRVPESSPAGRLPS